MSLIFISYRRADSAGYAGRIYDRLVARFGVDAVYMDVSRAEPGRRFIETIRSEVAQARALLVVIGPKWTSIMDDDGRPRLENPEDIVRVEIEAALATKDVRLIPVLVGGASVPRQRDIPRAVRELVEFDAIELTDTRWQQDLAGLLRTLQGVISRRVRAKVAVGGTLSLRRDVARRARLLALALATVPAAVIAFALGTPAPRTEQPALTSVASNRDVRLRFAAPWRVRDAPPRVPGLAFADPVALSRDDAAERAWLAAGEVDASGPSLLSTQFVRDLWQSPAKPERVRLGDGEALRYRGLRPQTLDADMTVYAIPTNKGVLTIACTPGRALARACDGVAASAQLLAPEPFPLEPSRDYATRINDVLRRLAAARAQPVRQFHSARSVEGQVDAAQTLATVFGAARRSFAGMDVSPAVAPAHRAIVRAVRSCARAYQAIARAAGGRRSSYGAARRSAVDAEARLAASMRSLRTLGYEVD